MAMSKRPPESQETLWVETAALRQSPGHPFYEKLNELLQTHGFDAFVEDLCAKYYHEKMGRPSIAPGVYFRMLLMFVGDITSHLAHRRAQRFRPLARLPTSGPDRGLKSL